MRNRPHNFVPNLANNTWDDVCAVCGKLKRDDLHKQSQTWKGKKRAK